MLKKKNKISCHREVIESAWDGIEEVEPDDIDRQMMHEMESDPDCNEFVNHDDIDWD